MKRIFKIIAIFILGMGGGIFAEHIFWPYFVERPLFYEYRLDKAPVNITEKKEVYIQENTALVDVVSKVERAVVATRSKSKTGQIIEGSGLIITTDGLMVTLAENIPQGQEFAFFVNGGAPSYQVLKRDLKENLALVKLEGNNFSTLGFASTDRLRIGERVFLIGSFIGNGSLNRIVNDGIIRSFEGGIITTTIKEESNFGGSVLFNILGDVVGINTIDKLGNVSTISSKRIRDFAGF